MCCIINKICLHQHCQTQCNTTQGQDLCVSFVTFHQSVSEFYHNTMDATNTRQGFASLCEPSLRYITDTYNYITLWLMNICLLYYYPDHMKATAYCLWYDYVNFYYILCDKCYSVDGRPYIHVQSPVASCKPGWTICCSELVKCVAILWPNLQNETFFFW